MRFKVTSEPTYAQGASQRRAFSIGDVVEVARTTPDSDGDVQAVGPHTEGEGRFIAFSCLTPIPDGIEETALRAALAALGVEVDVDRLLAVARKVEEALA